MPVMFFRILILILPLTLVGCSSWMPNFHKNKQYLSAESSPPLYVPPGLSSSAFEATYPVSNRTYPKSAADVSPLPPDLTSASG